MPQVRDGVPSHVTMLHSCAEMRVAIELSFRIVSGVTPDIHGVHVPQVEGTGCGVIC